eukprot:81968-Lingulodinium_polyedra.AAC.1
MATGAGDDCVETMVRRKQRRVDGSGKRSRTLAWAFSVPRRVPARPADGGSSACAATRRRGAGGAAPREDARRRQRLATCSVRGARAWR